MWKCVAARGENSQLDLGRKGVKILIVADYRLK